MDSVDEFRKRIEDLREKFRTEDPPMAEVFKELKRLLNDYKLNNYKPQAETLAKQLQIYYESWIKGLISFETYDLSVRKEFHMTQLLLNDIESAGEYKLKRPVNIESINFPSPKNFSGNSSMALNSGFKWVKFALILAAIIVIGIESYSLSLTSNKLEESIKNTAEISANISTSYIGAFPDNMNRVIELIKNAKKTLVIAVDVPAYGCLSAPNLFEEMEKQLKGRSENLENLVLYSGNDSVIMESCFDQFNLFNNNPDSIFKSIISNDKYKAYFESKQTCNANLGAFLNCLLKDHNGFLYDLNSYSVNNAKNRKIKLLTHLPPIRFWIRDDEEAVISFHSNGVPKGESSFHTTDRQLIEILKGYVSEFEKQGNSDWYKRKGDDDQEIVKLIDRFQDRAIHLP